MDVLEELFLNAKEDNYPIININKNIEDLGHREYFYLYKNIPYSNLIFYSDIKHEINAVFNIDSIEEFEDMLKYSKSLSIIKGIDGLLVKINIQGYKKHFSYYFDLKKSNNIYYIKKIIMDKFINVHIIIYADNTITKILSLKYNIEQSIIKDLKYITEFCYTRQYPRIIIKDEKANGYFIIVNSQTEVLDKLLDIVDRFQKFKTNEFFDIYVDYKNDMKLIFTDSISYDNFIHLKNEIGISYEIIYSGSGVCFGKPFLRYDNGKIYFLVK